VERRITGFPVDTVSRSNADIETEANNEARTQDTRARDYLISRKSRPT